MFLQVDRLNPSVLMSSPANEKTNKHGDTLLWASGAHYIIHSENMLEICERGGFSYAWSPLCWGFSAAQTHRSPHPESHTKQTLCKPWDGRLETMRGSNKSSAYSHGRQAVQTVSWTCHWCHLHQYQSGDDIIVHFILLKILMSVYILESVHWGMQFYLLNMALHRIINLSERERSQLNDRFWMLRLIKLSVTWHLWNKHTGNPPVSQRTRARRSLRSCWAQRWRGRWGILQGGDGSGCTLPAGWWRSRSVLLNSCTGRSFSSGAPAFCQRTGEWHEQYHVNICVTLWMCWLYIKRQCNSWMLFCHDEWRLIQLLHPCLHTSSGSWEKRNKKIKCKNLWKCCKFSTEASSVTDNGVFNAASYLVDGKANGFHVLPQFPHFPPVLLHQAHNESAALLLTIVRVIIHIIQLYDKLWIHPEGV